MYVYNTFDHLYYIKNGRKHRKGLEENPSRWIEARQVIADPFRGAILPGPPAPDPRPLGGHVGPPLPPPELSPEEKKAKLDEEETNKRREEMKAFIQEELRSNKRAQDMEPEELADLLSRKLRAQVPHAKPIPIPPRSQARPRTSRAQVVRPPTRRFIVRDPDSQDEESEYPDDYE